MATLQQAEAHRRAVQDLVTLAVRDLAAFWRTLDTADPAAAGEALQRVLPDLTAAYSSAAAGAAADWYDDLREDAGAAGRYRAVLAPPPPVERAEVLARWAVGPLFGATPEPGTALSKLAGGLQRIVADGSRETVRLNVRRDPADAKWARHASGNACAYCRFHASRGAVFRSEASAAKSHDHCHCAEVPVWPGDTFESPLADRWADEYAAARTKAGGDYKAIIKQMRESAGTH